MSRDLESRVQALEDIMAIENLKHTYLNACDAKDVELMKSTFKADHCDIAVSYTHLTLPTKRIV